MILYITMFIGLLSGPEPGNSRCLKRMVHCARERNPMTSKNRHENCLGLVESPGLLNLNELDLALLVELLTKLAPDVMNLHEEEQVTRLIGGMSENATYTYVDRIPPKSLFQLRIYIYITITVISG
jgi:hypothetical protein